MSSRRRGRASKKGAIIETGGPIMAHVGFEGARHMHPERMPTNKPEKTVSLRLLEMNNDTLENVQRYSGTIRRLMVEGLKLKTLSDSLVDRMVVLHNLDLGDNQLGDASLPDSFKKLESLVELNLNKNQFTKVPTAIRRLKNLTRLNLSHNDIQSLKGVEKLKKMQILMLDHNKFSQVFKEVSHMRKLEILDCSQNSIREIGLDIKYLKGLKELNISENRITRLPSDIFQLPRLESLKASHNQISKVPTFNMQPQNTHTITDIDLSANAINKFPGHLMFISKKLDLAGNRIKVLDWNKIKKADWNSDNELCVDDNPLTFPPSDVCESGIKSMMLFFQESEVNVRVYQGIKVLVIGATDSGKTSFVQSLVDGQSRLSQDMYEKSAGIEAYDMSFECAVPFPDDVDVESESVSSAHTSRTLNTSKSASRSPTEKVLNLTVWDFCGHPFYLFPHYVFFEQPAIAVLTFDMHQYKTEKFDEMIGCWFDWMLAKTNKLVVLLVGTHVDKLTKSKIQKVNNEVMTKLTSHLENQRQVVEERIKVITEKPHISPTLSAQLKAYMTLLKEKMTVQSELILTSASTYSGFDVMKGSIEKLANDNKLFQNVLRPIPTFWLDVENYTEEKGNSMVVPVMSWEDFKEEVTSKFGMKHLIPTIAQYLHEVGKVMWFSSNPVMKEFVFLRPSWLFDINKSLFRHDLKEKLNIEVEDAYRIIGMNQSKYDALKEEFLKEGIVDRDFLRCMLSHLIPLEMHSAFTEVLKLLTESFGLGYVVSKRSSKEADYNLDPDPENLGAKKILFPWFRKTDEPDSFREVWGALEARRKLVAVCRFPRYLPPGLFELLSVRAHNDKHRLRFLAHWGNGLHARHKVEHVQIMIAYSKHPEDHGTYLRFELRDDSDQVLEEVSAAAMWSILLPILLEFEELIQTFTGVLLERLMECPHCQQLSFLGEWNTPKETQSMQVRPCEECGEEVDTAFLVQPREKKRDDVLLTLAKRRQHRRHALQETPQAERATVVHAPVRQGRRAAVMPTDVLLMAPATDDVIIQSDDEDYDEVDVAVPTFSSRGRALLNPADLPQFNPGLFGPSFEDESDQEEPEEETDVLQQEAVSADDTISSSVNTSSHHVTDTEDTDRDATSAENSHPSDDT